VPFEGPYGFGQDRVATGWQRASLRPHEHSGSPSCERSHPLRPGGFVSVQIELGPSATQFVRDNSYGSSSPAGGYGRGTPSPASSLPPIKLYDHESARSSWMRRGPPVSPSRSSRPRSAPKARGD
jgi:hypothetical protein